MSGLGIERPTYCDDWGCPAAVSCARHFGRSHEYAAMRRADRDNDKLTGHGPGTWYFRGIRESCARYQYDKPKPWLAIQPGQITHIPKGHGG